MFELKGFSTTTPISLVIDSSGILKRPVFGGDPFDTTNQEHGRIIRPIKEKLMAGDAGVLAYGGATPFCLCGLFRWNRCVYFGCIP